MGSDSRRRSDRSGNGTGTRSRRRSPSPEVRKSRQEKARTVLKLWLLRTAIIGAVLFLAYRVIAIKMEYGNEYERLAMQQMLTKGSQSDMAINPNRGSIMDRNKQPLAVSTAVYNVFLDVKMLLERSAADDKDAKVPEDTIRDTFKIVNEILGTPMEQLYSYVAYNEEKQKYEYGEYQYLVFERQVKSKDALKLMDLKEEYLEKNSKILRDVYCEAQSERSYMYGSLAAQVIGFMRGDSSSGLEKWYNSSLTGLPGRIYQSFTDGGIFTERVEATEGNTLITTLDLPLQQFSEQLCEKYKTLYYAENAAVIVMNPYTGEVYTMAESPGFDLNDPANFDLVTDSGLSEQMNTLMAAGNPVEAYDLIYEVWKNFNISSSFEPGSIYKPITIAAALEEGIISPESTYYCAGYKEVAGRRINCNNTAGHGTQTLEQALINSCNVALMVIGEEIKKDIFYKYQHDFGYGEKTGIDLPGEEHCAALLHSLNSLGAQELATGSFGQRFNCTPIQAITSFAALINGGVLLEPYIVSQIADSSGKIVYEKKPTVSRKVISEETSAYLREVMEEVVSPAGTGRNAAISGYSIGGKTGTGEQGLKDEEGRVPHSLSFIGYLPVENPKYLVMSLIHMVPYEQYLNGATSAAPMIKELFQYLIDNKGIAPSDADVAAIPPDKAEVDNYVGMTVQEAIHLINEKGFNFELVGGAGTVITAQNPEPSKIVLKNSTIWLSFSDNGEYALKRVPSVIGLTPDNAANILTSEGFVPVFVYDDDGGRQNTTNAQASGSEGEAVPSDEITVPDELMDLPEIVYKQMPDADIMVMEGIEVKLKIR